MKFLHCADLHLDSALGSCKDAEKRKYRRAELLQNFVRMTEYAADHKADAILIAGDLFDTDGATKRTQNVIRETILRFPFLDFLYLKGNHDAAELFTAENCPKNLKQFGREWTCYEYGDVTIAGAEPGEGGLPYGELVLSSERCNLVMLHGQISQHLSEEADCIVLPELKNKNIDYLALGHIHSYRAEALDDRGIWCYSGCLEGRGFDECGEKGFVWIETDGTKVSHTFVPFAKRLVHEVPVDITGAESTVAVEMRIADALEGISEKDLVHVSLCGATGIDAERDLTYLVKRFETAYFAFALTDREVRLTVDAEQYKNDISLRGEFVRLVLAGDYPENEKRKMLELGMRALAGEEVDTCF